MSFPIKQLITPELIDKVRSDPGANHWTQSPLERVTGVDIDKGNFVLLNNN